MSTILNEVVGELAEMAVETMADFIDKNKKKSAAEDQRLEDLKNVAVLGGAHD